MKCKCPALCCYGYDNCKRLDSSMPLPRRRAVLSARKRAEKVRRKFLILFRTTKTCDELDDFLETEIIADRHELLAPDEATIEAMADAANRRDFHKSTIGYLGLKSDAQAMLAALRQLRGISNGDK